MLRRPVANSQTDSQTDDQTEFITGDPIICALCAGQRACEMAERFETLNSRVFNEACSLLLLMGIGERHRTISGSLQVNCCSREEQQVVRSISWH